MRLYIDGKEIQVDDPQSGIDFVFVAADGHEVIGPVNISIEGKLEIHGTRTEAALTVQHPQGLSLVGALPHEFLPDVTRLQNYEDGA